MRLQSLPADLSTFTPPAFFSQFTDAQMAEGYERALVPLRSMLAKAQATGRKVNGYTAEELMATIDQQARLAAEFRRREAAGR